MLGLIVCIVEILCFYLICRFNKLIDSGENKIIKKGRFLILGAGILFIVLLTIYFFYCMTILVAGDFKEDLIVVFYIIFRIIFYKKIPTIILWGCDYIVLGVFLYLYMYSVDVRCVVHASERQCIGRAAEGFLTFYILGIIGIVPVIGIISDFITNIIRYVFFFKKRNAGTNPEIQGDEQVNSEKNS